MHTWATRNARLAWRLALVVSLCPLPARAWIGIVDRPADVGRSLVAYGPRGDVVVAGRTDVSGDQGLLTVAKFSRSGRLRWQSTLPDVLTTDPRSLAVDRTGNVYVAGAVGGDDEDTFGPFTVIKLDGRTGREAWRWRPSEREGAAGQVIADPWGDVFVAGYHLVLDDEGEETAVGVIAKLDRATGVPRWVIERRQSVAWAVALLSDGDVATSEGGDVLRRSGVTGRVVWQTATLLTGDRPQWLVADRRGDLIAVTAGGGVSKLGGDDGAIRWQSTRSGFTPAPARVIDVALDRYGDVFLCGRLVDGSDFGDFAVVKVAGESGAELWRFIESRDGMGEAVAVAVDGRGDAVATGRLEGYPSSPHLEVLRLDGRTGTVDWLQGRREIGVGHDVAVDRAGRAVVSGFLVFPDPPPDGDSQLVVAQLSASGRGLSGPRRGHAMHGRLPQGRPVR